MVVAPLLVKYQTESGNYYVYDPELNEIVRVGETVYRIIDDFGVLTTPEILEKYRSFGSAKVWEALAAIKTLRAGEILYDNAVPQVSSAAERIVCQGKEESFEAFLETRRRLLILELTQNCNLRCAYCVYGSSYPEMRNHGEQTMSLHHAQCVIDDFLRHRSYKHWICFYGGEPLLEFTLLKDIVLYASQMAQEQQGRVGFALMTNGTLLTDEIIHFLVKYDFEVRISLDGDKESHDRYRRFRHDGHHDAGHGSYDVVRKNLDRFVELYPKYEKRGVVVTITATTDLDESHAMLRHLRVSGFEVTASSIRVPQRRSSENADDAFFGSGFWGQPLCEDNVCLTDRRDSQKEGSGSSEFVNWTEERRHCLQLGRRQFVDRLCMTSDPFVLRDEFPLFFNWFSKNNRRIHLRQITPHRARVHFGYRCYPGATRTFCSAKGVIYPCEKGETGKLHEIGDAQNGVDCRRALRLSDMMRLLADCGNCVSKRICSSCPAMVSDMGGSGRADALAFQEQCQLEIASLPGRLAEYTTVMEMNQGVLDKFIAKAAGNEDWLSDVRIVPTEEQLCEIEVDVEELEEEYV